jgi:tRNA(adenine34) deaminase
MSMAEERAFMRAALEEARLAFEADEVPIGAVLVHNGEIIARAHNAVERSGDPTAHAEMTALREGAKKLGAWRLANCTLYVTLEPCAMCAGAAVNARLARLVFGAHEEKTGCCGSVLDLTDAMFLHTVECCGGVLEEECAALLASYFAKKR